MWMKKNTHDVKKEQENQKIPTHIFSYAWYTQHLALRTCMCVPVGILCNHKERIANRNNTT
jgi:hypothetical protein